MLLGISTLLWVQRSLVPVGVVVKLGGVAAVLAPVRDLVLQAAETAGELVPVGHNATNSGGQGQGPADDLQHKSGNFHPIMPPNP